VNGAVLGAELGVIPAVYALDEIVTRVRNTNLALGAGVAVGALIDIAVAASFGLGANTLGLPADKGDIGSAAAILIIGAATLAVPLLDALFLAPFTLVR
jgi:hypothetical protein